MTVTVFEKNDRIGGLLRYGIPDFKMEKHLIDRRVEQMEAEGVVFRAGVQVTDKLPEIVNSLEQETVLAGGPGEGVRRGGARRRRGDAAGPADSGPRAERHPLRDGVPAAAEPGRRR